ncbi:hypothetical protein F511_47566 [Dorcoceras hygrometricum]|uniref:Uncharacterized protein n=1 Tax=Dorcoceras hygrometricum TaxID=472368 RepID=A0A2Z6ZXY2_9LAMI|nr:hypothetical protein F511_47566 [Dorcoceras hygrometricum]
MDVRRSSPTDAAGFLRNCCANSSDHAQECCAVIGHAWRGRAASARLFEPREFAWWRRPPSGEFVAKVRRLNFVL